MKPAVTSVLLATATTPSAQQAVLPSVFELYLVDQIDELLKPAFHHIYSAVLGVLPERIADALQSKWREIYTMVQLVAQYHCVNMSSRTISEGIYGLQRVQIHEPLISSGASGASTTMLHGLNHQQTSSLTAMQRDISVMLVAVMPNILETLGKIAAAIKRRRNLRLERLQEHALAVSRFATEQSSTATVSDDHGSSLRFPSLALASTPNMLMHPPPPAPTPPTGLQLSQEFFSASFQFVKISYDLAVLGQRLLYCFGHSPYSHPLLALAGVAIVRPQREGGGGADLSHSLAGSAAHPLLKARSGSSSSTGLATVDWRMGVLLACLVVARVAAAAAEPEDDETIALMGTGRGAAYSASHADTLARQNIAELPMPKPPSYMRGGLLPTNDHSCCPICRQSPRQYPAVSTGGFVFCYSCISAAVSRDGICPISGIPCRVEDLISLFVGLASYELSGSCENDDVRS